MIRDHCKFESSCLRMLDVCDKLLRSCLLAHHRVSNHGHAALIPESPWREAKRLRGLPRSVVADDDVATFRSIRAMRGRGAEGALRGPLEARFESPVRPVAGPRPKDETDARTDYQTELSHLFLLAFEAEIARSDCQRAPQMFTTPTAVS